MMTTVPLQGEHATLPISQLTIEPQIRTRNGFDEASIKELSASIQQHGLLQPIVVARISAESYRVIAGHRRLLACERIGMQEIQAMVRPEMLRTDERAAQAIENLQRVDLALMDKADGVAALVKDAGAKRAAQLLGKSAAWISKHVSLTKLPELVRKLAEEGFTADVEILLILRKLARLDKSGTTLLPLLAKIRAGQASRQTVLDAVARFERPTVSAEGLESGADDFAEEGDDEPTGQETTRGEKFGKLELAEDTAHKLLAALQYAQEHKPSSRPGIELIGHVEAFIAKTWGAK